MYGEYSCGSSCRRSAIPLDGNTRPTCYRRRAAAPGTTDLDHREDLRRLLDRMPPRQRAVLVLRYYDDLSIEQTAEVLGCSAGAVKSLTVRAIDSIRGLLPAGVTTRTDYEEAL